MQFNEYVPKTKFVFLSEPVNPFIEFPFFQCSTYSMPWRQKLSGLLPPDVAQLSDLVLEGTSFSIKKQGTTVKRNEAYFMLLFFFLTVGFSFIGAFWIPLRLFPTLLV